MRALNRACDREVRMAESDNTELLELARQRYHELLQEVHRVIIGQDDVVQNLVSALFARGHCLLIGVPGLAKTLLVKSVAQSLSWEFKRIQFTPDLMPSDIIGTEILDTDPGAERRTLRFVKGPIFANIILADEINRTPPKTQSALLEAMQEYAVTVGGRTLPIEPPFFVVATQNSYLAGTGAADMDVGDLGKGHPLWHYLILCALLCLFAEQRVGQMRPRVLK
jgi:MoxR-like ATPase